MTLDEMQADALCGHINYYFDRGNVTREEMLALVNMHEEMLALVNMHRDHSIVNIAISAEEFEASIRQSTAKALEMLKGFKNE